MNIMQRGDSTLQALQNSVEMPCSLARCGSHSFLRLLMWSSHPAQVAKQVTECWIYTQP